MYVERVRFVLSFFSNIFSVLIGSADFSFVAIKALERMGGETSHCPSKRAMRGTPRRFLEENVRPRRRLLQFDLFMDEEVDELGDHLEDLGIEIGVEFLYYAELCETFWRIKKLGSRKSCSSLVQAVAIAHLDL